MSMHADEDSDEVVVPEKRSNKEGFALGGDRGGKGLAQGKRWPGDRGPDSEPGHRVEPDWKPCAKRRDRAERVRFTALLHHITIDLLKQSYRALKRDAAPGIDGVTWWSLRREPRSQAERPA